MDGEPACAKALDRTVPDLLRHKKPVCLEGGSRG